MEYNYVAQEDDELTLRKGDIITGIKMMLGGWWEGTLRDKRDMFPDNFVKVSRVESSLVTYHPYTCIDFHAEVSGVHRYWTPPRPLAEATAAKP